MPQNYDESHCLYEVTSDQVENVVMLGQGADGYVFRCKYKADDNSPESLKFRDTMCVPARIGGSDEDPKLGYYFVLKIPKSTAEIVEEQITSNYLNGQPGSFNRACGIKYNDGPDGKVFGTQGAFAREGISDFSQLQLLNRTSDGSQSTLALASRLEAFDIIPSVIPDQDPEFCSGNLVSFFKDIKNNRGKIPALSKAGYASAFDEDMDITMGQTIFSILKGLEDIHNANVLHLDMAFRNSLVSEPVIKNGVLVGFKAVVADYGRAIIVKDINDKIQTDSTVHPLKWSDQERLNNRILSQISDFFASRVVFFEGLSSMTGFYDQYFPAFVKNTSPLGGNGGPDSPINVAMFVGQIGNDRAMDVYTGLVQNTFPAESPGTTVLNSFFNYVNPNLIQNSRTGVAPILIENLTSATEQNLLHESAVNFYEKILTKKMQAYDGRTAEANKQIAKGGVDVDRGKKLQFDAMKSFVISMNRLMQPPVSALDYSQLPKEDPQFQLFAALKDLVKNENLLTDEWLQANENEVKAQIEKIKILMNPTVLRNLMAEATALMQNYNEQVSAVAAFLETNNDPQILSLQDFTEFNPDTGIAAELAIRSIETRTSDLKREMEQNPLSDQDRLAFEGILRSLDTTKQLIAGTKNKWDDIAALEQKTYEIETARKQSILEGQITAYNNEKGLWHQDQSPLNFAKHLSRLLSIVKLYREIKHVNKDLVMPLDPQLEFQKWKEQGQTDALAPVWKEFASVYEATNSHYNAIPEKRREQRSDQSKGSLAPKHPAVRYAEQMELMMQGLGSANKVKVNAKISEGLKKSKDIQLIENGIANLKNINGRLGLMHAAQAEYMKATGSKTIDPKTTLALAKIHGYDVSTIENELEELLALDRKTISAPLKSLEARHQKLHKKIEKGQEARKRSGTQEPSEYAKPLPPNPKVINNVLSAVVSNTIKHQNQLPAIAAAAINNFLTPDGELKSDNEMFPLAKSSPIKLSEEERILFEHFLQPYRLLASLPPYTPKKSESTTDAALNILHSFVNQNDLLTQSLDECAKNKAAFLELLIKTGAIDYPGMNELISLPETYMRSMVQDALQIENMTRSQTESNPEIAVVIPEAKKLLQERKDEIESYANPQKRRPTQSTHELYEERTPQIRKEQREKIIESAESLKQHITLLQKAGKLEKKDATRIKIMIDAVKNDALNAEKTPTGNLQVKDVIRIFKDLKKADSKEALIAGIELKLPEPEQLLTKKRSGAANPAKPSKLAEHLHQLKAAIASEKTGKKLPEKKPVQVENDNKAPSVAPKVQAQETKKATAPQAVVKILSQEEVYQKMMEILAVLNDAVDDLARPFIGEEIDKAKKAKLDANDGKQPAKFLPPSEEKNLLSKSNMFTRTADQKGAPVTSTQQFSKRNST